MPITNLHLLTFVDRLDAIRENLHLRTLTDREVQDIIDAGFTTETSGVYNPIYSKPKWKNVKDPPYRKENFEIHSITPLTIISVKERSKKFHLTVAQDFDFVKSFSLSVALQSISRGFTELNVIKSCLAKEKSTKISILSKITGQESYPININTNLETSICTPVTAMTWVKTKILSKLGVKLKLKSKIQTRVSDGSYLYDDVGSISDIEMIELIREIEQTNAI